MLSDNTLRLAFKYRDTCYPFISIKRNSKNIIVNQQMVKHMNAFEAKDLHINYPENGHVHYTIKKDKEYVVHIFQKSTSINFNTSSHDPADLPDYNAIALLTLPYKLFAREGPELNAFKEEDFYTFPTTAFAVNEGTLSGRFATKKLKKYYEAPIDLSNLNGYIINVHTILTGSKEIIDRMHFGNDPTSKVLLQSSIGVNPTITVTITARPNA